MGAASEESSFPTVVNIAYSAVLASCDSGIAYKCHKTYLLVVTPMRRRQHAVSETAENLHVISYPMRYPAGHLNKFCNIDEILSNAVTLLVERRTCDLQVAGSSLGWAPLRSGLGPAIYICVPLSPSSIIKFDTSQRVICLAGKVTAGLVESNGSLPLGL